MCWVLDITDTEEQLLMNMRKTTRYEIRRGEKLDVSISVGRDESDIKKFYSLYDETSKRHGFVQHQEIFQEYSVFSKDGRAILYLASVHTEVLAGAIILYLGDQAIYHHGASMTSKIPASYVLQWRAIADAKKRGLKVYNFWGIAPDDNQKHPWRGITLFKKGFGGREIRYMHAQDYPLSPLYLFTKTIKGARRRMKGY